MAAPRTQTRDHESRTMSVLVLATLPLRVDHIGEILRRKGVKGAVVEWLWFVRTRLTIRLRAGRPGHPAGYM